MGRERSQLVTELERTRIIVTLPSWLDARSARNLLESYLDFGLKAFILPNRMIKNDPLMLARLQKERPDDKMLFGISGLESYREVPGILDSKASFVISEEVGVAEACRKHPLICILQISSFEDIVHAKYTSDFVTLVSDSKVPIEPKVLKTIMREHSAPNMIPGNVSDHDLLIRYFREAGSKMAIVNFGNTRHTELEIMKRQALHLANMLDPRSNYLHG